MKLHIVGDGKIRNYPMELTRKLGIEDHVMFHGHVPHKRLAEIHGKSDVFVLPSVCAEGFPLVLLETMKQGLPVITTNFGGQAEIVKQGFNGELANPRDPEDLAEKIYILLNYSETAKNLGKNAKIFAESFDSSDHIKRLEAVYNR